MESTQILIFLFFNGASTLTTDFIQQSVLKMKVIQYVLHIKLLLFCTLTSFLHSLLILSFMRLKFY